MLSITAKAKKKEKEKEKEKKEEEKMEVVGTSKLQYTPNCIFFFRDRMLEQERPSE